MILTENNRLDKNDLDVVEFECFLKQLCNGNNTEDD